MLAYLSNEMERGWKGSSPTFQPPGGDHETQGVQTPESSQSTSSQSTRTLHIRKDDVFPQR